MSRRERAGRVLTRAERLRQLLPASVVVLFAARFCTSAMRGPPADGDLDLVARATRLAEAWVAEGHTSGLVVLVARRGMVVILELHWTGAGSAGTSDELILNASAS